MEKELFQGYWLFMYLLIGLVAMVTVYGTFIGAHYLTQYLKSYKPSRLQKAMYRWAIVLAGITSLFWGIWWLVKGQVPSNTVWNLEISHWWDILVMPLVVLTFPLFKKAEEYDYLRRQKCFYPKKLDALILANIYLTHLASLGGIVTSHGSLVVGFISGLLIALAGNALILCCYALFLVFRFIFSTALWKKIWKKTSSWLTGY